MKLLTGLRHFVLSVIMLISVNVSAQLSAVETNPMQYAIITEMSNKLDAEASTQISSFNKMAATQGMICSEVDGMKKWQKNYNNYLQNARGYAEAIKAATTLYADGVEILRNIFDIKKACKVIGPVKLYGSGKQKANSKTGINLKDIAPYLLATNFKYHHQYKSYGRHNS